MINFSKVAPHKHVGDAFIKCQMGNLAIKSFYYEICKPDNPTTWSHNIFW